MVDGAVIADKLWPIVAKCMNDSVPNLRFVSLKVAKSLSKKVDNQMVLNQIKQYKYIPILFLRAIQSL